MERYRENDQDPVDVALAREAADRGRVLCERAERLTVELRREARRRLAGARRDGLSPAGGWGR